MNKDDIMVVYPVCIAGDVMLIGSGYGAGMIKSDSDSDSDVSLHNFTLG